MSDLQTATVGLPELEIGQEILLEHQTRMQQKTESGTGTHHNTESVEANTQHNTKAS